MDLVTLATTLSKMNNEDDVISYLVQENLWDDSAYWRPFGGNENNFSIIGNQQSAPDAALVEKIINSVDAVLVKESLLNGIDPESLTAPTSITDALVKFYNIRDGNLSNLDTKQRNIMSQSILLFATGQKSNPCFTIVDQGEGQTPKRMPDTILSLNKSNKLRIAFVQGKFNMGGTGVLPFCGNHNMQLIITKRCPKILNKDDNTSSHWGITLVRRENPFDGRKSSMYTYLTNKDGTIMSFKSEGLKIIPDLKHDYKVMEYGMFIKLYNYNIPSFKTNILFDLNYRIALLIPNLAHPVRLIECRNYEGHSLETTLSGLIVRLTEDKRENIENGFPITINFALDGQRLNAVIYLFKPNAKVESYKKNEGVLFVVNGQTHGILSKKFFQSNSVGFSYIADSMLILIDCSELNPRLREDLFMNSRDRLRENSFKKNLEKELAYALKHNEALRLIQEERRRKALVNSLDNDKPLSDLLAKILKPSPTLSNLFMPGGKVSNPFNLAPSNKTKEFVGKLFPSFFILQNKPKDNIITKHVPLNHKFRMKYETDVVNDYFFRIADSGEFELFANDKKCLNFSLNLYNGIANLTIELPQYTKVGDTIRFKSIVKDNCNIKKFIEEFIVIVDPPQEKKNGYPGKRKQGSSKNGHHEGNLPKGLDLPKTVELYQKDWLEYEISKEDALVVKNAGTGSIYDFFINMDNIFLSNEIRVRSSDIQTNLAKAQFKYSMVLIGLSVINYFRNNDITDKEFWDVETSVRKISTMVAPIIIPLFNLARDFGPEEVAASINESM